LSAAGAPCAENFVAKHRRRRLPARLHRFFNTTTHMARDTVILECTEARKEGKRPSRYMTTRNKKIQQEKVEKLKYNPALKRRTLHKEIKG
jgi:large subunit ribosomal protein L33